MRILGVMLAVVLATGTALAGAGPKAETITIEGKTYSVVPDEALRARGYELPDVPRDQNAAFDYLRALEAYWEPEGLTRDDELWHAIGNWRWSGKAGPQVREYLEENRKALALIEAAASKPQCHFPFLLEEGQTLGEDTPLGGLMLPYLGKIRGLTRFLVVEGKAREFEGRTADALDAYMLALRIGGHVAQDPFLISGLLGIACTEIGRRPIEQCLLRHELDEETLAQAQTCAFEIGKGRPDVRIGLGGESVFSTDAVERIIRDPDIVMNFFEELPTAEQKAWIARLKTKEGQEELRREARAFWDEMEKQLELPFAEFVATLEEVGKGASSKRRSPIMEQVMESVERGRIQYGRADLSWNVLDVMFALARHKAKHGAYPETLEEAKGLMLSDGTDPYTGKGLKYRLEEDGSFTIWSVGENLKDGGGKVETKHDPWRGGDYVWNSRVLAGMK